MSTRVSLAYGPDFHLFEEMTDGQNIYLELKTTHYEAGYGSVVVPIPLHVWEVIRRCTLADFSLADLTDEEIEEQVEREVEERSAHSEGPLDESHNPATIPTVGGMSADAPVILSREAQIAHGVAYWQSHRKHQQELRAAVQALLGQNPSCRTTADRAGSTD